MEETITIPLREYELLKMKANIDLDLLSQMVESFRDIKSGNFRKVK